MDETILSLECKKAEIALMAATLQLASEKYNKYLEVFVRLQKQSPEDYPEGFPELLASREAFFFLLKAIRHQLEVQSAMVQASKVTRH